MQFDCRLYVKIENEMDCAIARLARAQRIKVSEWVRTALWKQIKAETEPVAPKSEAPASKPWRLETGPPVDKIDM